MEIFKQTNFDFLGKKWPFITLSLILTAAGLVSLAVKGGPRYGIDFTGGALMDVNFIKRPPAEAIRSAIRKRVSGGIEVQEISNSQEVLISTEGRDERALEVVRRDMIAALNESFGQKTDKLGINTTGQSSARGSFARSHSACRHPDGRGSVAGAHESDSPLS